MSEETYVNVLTGLKAIIEYEPDPDFGNPREMDNVGTMICFHKRYNLGDKHNLTLEEAIEVENDPDNFVLPVYIYDHSGITISTEPFSCPWDSGKLGFIYASKDKVKEEGISEDRILDILKSEVDYYDDFLTGEVYGVRVFDEDEEEVESTWGIVGFEDAKEIAREMIS